MTVLINIENQPVGNDQIPAGEICRKACRVIDNPKHMAAWAMISMTEACIDMTDFNASIADIESMFTAEAVRERAKDFMEDMLQEFRDSVHEAIDDPEFCKAFVSGVKFKRSSMNNNIMVVDDIDVDLKFDFKLNRR